MSQTTRYVGLCDMCGCTVPARQGVIRRWNGAARRHAPRHAKLNPEGVLSALHCTACDGNYRKLGEKHV